MKKVKIKKGKQDWDVVFQNANDLDNQGRFAEALSLYELLLKQFPNHLALLESYASALFSLRRFEHCLRIYDKSLTIDNAQAHVYLNKGIVLQQLKRYSEALACYDRALALNQDYAQAYSNQGIVLKELERYSEAMENYDKAISLNPGYSEAYYNRGNVFKELKQFTQAIENYDLAVTLRPDFAEAYWNKSLLLLLQGNFLEGWPLYEWRFKNKSLNIQLRDLSEPRFFDQDISHKTILLYQEQGLGDTIQFCRFAKLLADLGAKVILEVHSPLVTLISTLDARITVVANETNKIKFDYHGPLMSLPIVCKTIPAEIGYLSVDAGKSQIWRKRLGEKRQTRIGLVWSGSRDHLNDHNRSIAVELLAALFDLSFEFHCLQKEVRLSDLMALQNQPKLATYQDLLDDFSDTAALVAEMDLVITVDTAVAHLSGALGKVTWVLLPHIPDFRWLLDRTDSPWYPSVRLFRQDETRNWQTVIAEIIRHLQDFSV